MSEAQRKASQAYKEKLERRGIKVVSFRLSEASRSNLKRWALREDCSQSSILETLLEQHEGEG